MSGFLRFNEQNEVILASSECAKQYCEYKRDTALHRVSSPEEVQREARDTLRDRNIQFTKNNVSINNYEEN